MSPFIMTTSFSFPEESQKCFSFLEKSLGRFTSLDVDLIDAQTLWVTLPTNRVYLFQIQHHLQQIWMSSPFSGGKHFHWKDHQWRDTRQDGATLFGLLEQELAQELKEPFALPS